MKKFLIKSVSYLLAFLFAYLTAVISILYFNTRISSSCKLDENAKILIAGDSHITWGINDKYLKKAQNISLTGEGYIFTYAKLKELVNNENNIDYLFLGFGYHNISDYYDDYIYGIKTLGHYPNYLGVLKGREHLKLIKYNPNNFFRLGGLIIRNGISGIFKKKCSHIGEFPSDKMLHTLRMEDIDNRIKEQYYYDGKDCSYSEINLNYLNKIILLCEENNIDIVFLSTPLNDIYKSKVPTHIINKYDSLVNDYNFQLINFEGFSLPDSCYLPDGDHLNYNGSIYASKKLNEIIQENFSYLFNEPEISGKNDTNLSKTTIQ